MLYRAARSIGRRRLMQYVRQDIAIAVGSVPRELDAIVVSFGGAGCTFLLQHMAQFMRTNDANSHVDGLKHVNRPSHPMLSRYRIGRAVYVFDDPRRSVISLFRRGFHTHMRVKLTSNHRTLTGYHLDIAGQSVDFAFDDYLAQGVDNLGIISHWRKWSSAEPVRFPTLFVKFDALHRSVDELRDFLELPQRFAVEFPSKQKRNSDQVALTPTQAENINRIYGALADEIAAAPATFRRNP